MVVVVFKSKYDEHSKGPNAMDLQQFVLEELRVPVFYMKCWRVKEKEIVARHWESPHGNIE